MMSLFVADAWSRQRSHRAFHWSLHRRAEPVRSYRVLSERKPSGTVLHTSSSRRSFPSNALIVAVAFFLGHYGRHCCLLAVVAATWMSPFVVQNCSTQCTTQQSWECSLLFCGRVRWLLLSLTGRAREWSNQTRQHVQVFTHPGHRPGNSRLIILLLVLF